MKTLSETLESRGFVYQHSAKSLAEITDGQKRTVYLGVDPTADSIHVGNLAVYMLLRHFADAGHTVILLFGGGTGLIGDPKPDMERPLIDEATVAQRIEKMQKQAQKLLGGVPITVVNNNDWLGDLKMIPFLRDVGKHFTVNTLMKKDAIHERLSSEDGISYTEFAYPVLQAYDFWHLHTTHNCDVQVSGSDQWGNIVAGVDLIRRKEGATVFGLTMPLIIDKATGRKFGKSEGNAVWLDPEKTSPFAFYQFWLNISDESVIDHLKIFTLLADEEIATIASSHEANPGARLAQRTLARAVTALVHGEESSEAVAKVSDVLFGEKDISELSDDERILLRREAPVHEVRIGQDLTDVIVQSGLAASKREARQLVTEGGLTLNGARVTDTNRNIMQEDFQNAPLALLKKGKRTVVVLVPMK